MKENNVELLEELETLKAENEALKENQKRQDAYIEMQNKEMEETKDTLGEMVKRLGQTRDLLHSSLELQAKYKNISNNCMGVLRDFVMELRTRKNRNAILQVLEYYNEEGTMRLLVGVMSYLLLGKKYKADSALEMRHFEVICQRLDDDAITLPAHSLMVKLIVKYGLFEKIKDKLK